VSDRPAIEISALRKVFHRGRTAVVALDGIDMTVERGAIYGVLGPSGAGKSTLIRTLNGLERPTAGSVRVDGVELPALKGAALRAQRRRIGMVFQHFNLLSSRTAAGNVALPLEIAGLGRRERATRAAELLELVGLSSHADAHPAQLSGGQKQRVGIARALAAEPTVLLSDEATSALDEDTSASVLGLLRELNERLGVTIVLITHQLSIVKRMCDAATLLDDGRVVDAGPLADIVGRPGSPLGTLLLPELDADEHPHPADLVLLDDAARAALQPGGPLSRLDAVVLGASTETIAGRYVARVRVGLEGSPEARAHALATLRGDVSVAEATAA
jgi:D-methionine transport system ATP-binding protein